MNRCSTIGLAVIPFLWLGACGGGGGGSSTSTASAASAASAASTASAAGSASTAASTPTTTAQSSCVLPAVSASASGASAAAAGAAGLWTGSTGDSRSYAQLVLGSGAYYLFYSPINDGNSVGGVMSGTGTVSGQTFAAPDGRIFDIQTSGVQTTALTGTFVAKSSFNGNYTTTANGSTSIVTFAGTYDTSSAAAPTLADLAGTYAGDNGSNAGVQTGASMTVSGDGTVILNAAGSCSASGTARPRTDGNAFDLALKFGAGCALPNQCVTGVAYNNVAAHRLYTLTPTANRSDFFVFVGGKQ